MTDEEQKTNSEVVGEREQSWLARAAAFFLEILKIAILAGVTIGLVRYFLFKPFYVKGQSMEPNFLEKDYLIIDEISYRFREPQRGEVVVFRAPTDNGDFYLKRIVGLPGETVRIDDSKIIISNYEHPGGVFVEEFYLSEETPGALAQTLGPDEYFVLGDNRDASYDSRRFGPVVRKDIIGRTWFRGWPFSRVNKFNAPDYNF